MSDLKKMEIEIHHEKHAAEREYRKIVKDLKKAVEQETVETKDRAD